MDYNQDKKDVEDGLEYLYTIHDMLESSPVNPVDQWDAYSDEFGSWISKLLRGQEFDVSVRRLAVVLEAIDVDRVSARAMLAVADYVPEFIAADDDSRYAFLSKVFRSKHPQYDINLSIVSTNY